MKATGPSALCWVVDSAVHKDPFWTPFNVKGWAFWFQRVSCRCFGQGTLNFFRVKMKLVWTLVIAYSFIFTLKKARVSWLKHRQDKTVAHAGIREPKLFSWLCQWRSPRFIHSMCLVLHTLGGRVHCVNWRNMKYHFVPIYSRSSASQSYHTQSRLLPSQMMCMCMQCEMCCWVGRGTRKVFPEGRTGNIRHNATRKWL